MTLHCLGTPGSQGRPPQGLLQGRPSSGDYISQDAPWPRLSQHSKGRSRRELPKCRSPVRFVDSQGSSHPGSWEIGHSLSAPGSPHVLRLMLDDTERAALALFGWGGGGVNRGRHWPGLRGVRTWAERAKGTGESRLCPGDQRRCTLEGHCKYDLDECVEVHQGDTTCSSIVSEEPSSFCGVRAPRQLKQPLRITAGRDCCSSRVRPTA